MQVSCHYHHLDLFFGKVAERLCLGEIDSLVAKQLVPYIYVFGTSCTAFFINYIIVTRRGLRLRGTFLGCHIVARAPSAHIPSTSEVPEGTFSMVFGRFH